MKRLSRHLFQDCAATSLVTLGTLTFLIMLPQILLLTDVWINKGAPFSVLRQMILLAIPQFMVGTLPMALLTGILLTLNRMARDSELVIIKASGVSIWQMLRPVGLLVVLFTVLSLLLNWIWVPRAFFEFTTLKRALLTSSSALTLQPRTFNRDIPGLTLHVERQDPISGTLEGVLIHDQRNPKEVVTITARRAHPHTRADNKAALFLEDGSRHWVTQAGYYRHMQFTRFDLGLEVVLGLVPAHQKESVDELDPDELLAMLDQGTPEKRHAALLEWHRRLAFPAATLIMGALALPLGVRQSHRTGKSFGFAAALLILILHFLLLASGEALATRKFTTPLIGLWLPNLIMAALTAWAFHFGAQGRLAPDWRWPGSAAPVPDPAPPDPHGSMTR
ncbi:Lipopolysaccharide export system permease protein LptF [Candidatus Magnetaquicoccaceae bacterium FCR-1]|uniref:Lipopolysaccharide export system permease protein LptF n=1 Tax=Candidatus Magnetaquiglobus chichijimensis TaxID=3141448 RepID=A0ABQ0CDL4_9PROT